MRVEPNIKTLEKASIYIQQQESDSIAAKGVQDDRKVNLVKPGDGVKLPKKEVLCKIDSRRLIKNSNAPTDVSTAIARATGQKLAGLSFLQRPLIIQERERILRLLISFPKWLLRRGTGELHQLGQTEAPNTNIPG